ncbi:platelet endothelial aggregation receptor 1-like [Culex quinquefasciatus]|uniref:platelet endothelial aggregation receptor 1-like n=1 Tax=Culex quinquefasciatus TaxID=7176 RepID=UPI0018E353A4|nr:platelet endothelial aggregation receptor 1-like [Culex quinquefasciatus]
MIRLTLPLIAMLIWDAVEAQNVLGSMMWPSYSGINAQLGMAGAAEEPCSTGDLKFGYQWKYGQDFKVQLNKCCDQYRQEGDECVALCENCYNGFCNVPNDCICNSNYHKNLDSNRCEPNTLEQCKLSCENGFCDDEARCHCDGGFFLGKDGRCTKDKEDIIFCVKIIRKGKVCLTRGKKSRIDDVYE